MSEGFDHLIGSREKDFVGFHRPLLQQKEGTNMRYSKGKDVETFADFDGEASNQVCKESFVFLRFIIFKLIFE